MNEPTNREVAVLNVALELRPAQRAAYLDEACAGDPALRQRVEDLLGAYAAAEGFLETPPPGLGATGNVSVSAPLTEKPGDRIGHYKLLQEIGEGGCGVVYMAEQEEPVRRRVALKVIKLGMDTKQVIARFEAERQALALMDHPNIAKIFDAGVTSHSQLSTLNSQLPLGRPYFVMELVRGIKITDFCNENKASTEDRLKLFIQVCRAIQHAHQKGVIHRDIKPSNILVTINDGVPVPKVIDFGIAKATQGRLTDQTLFTAFEQFIGTPAYMSPEQAVLTSLDIDTRSDIYSLGVLLYELLTGKTPFDQKELLAAGLDEMRRTIREKEPLKPSTRLTQELAAAEVVGHVAPRAPLSGEDASLGGAHGVKRPTSHLSPLNSQRLKELIHVLRGDLDWIAMKCLEKDRSRRYETANGLAADIQRHLNCEPVVARPPSPLYEFQKTVRRHKFGFAAAAALIAVLAAGAGVSTLEAIRAMRAEREQFRQRQQVEASEKQARALNQFLMEDVLGQATPEQNASEKNITVVEALNVATHRLDQRAEIGLQPELEASLRLAVGRTYSELGLLSEAERNLRRAVTLRRNTLTPQHLDTFAAQHELAKLLSGQRKHEEAEGLAREAWQGRLRLLGPEHRDTLSSEELYEEALADQAKFQEAEPIARQILQIRERVLGPDDPATMSSLGDLGELLQLRGNNPEAEAYFRQTLTRLQRNGLADTRDGFLCVKELAITRLLQGDPVEAEKLLAEALSRAKKRLGPDNFLTLFIQRVLVRALAEEQRLVEAEALGKETLNARLRTRANQDEVGTGRTLLYLGRVLVEQGKLDEAEPRLQEALTIFRVDASNKARPELAAEAANWLGVIQIGRKSYPEAAALMLPEAERFFVVNAEMSPNERRMAVGHIIKLYEAWGKPDQAATCRKNLDDYFAKSQTAVRAQ